MILVLFSSCSGPGSSSESAPSETPQPSSTLPLIPSQTPFIPDLSTATPGILHLWLSPVLPKFLSSPLLELTNLNGRPVEIVWNADAADVRVEPWPEVSLTQWILALVVPFPSILDGMTMNELMEIWQDENLADQKLYLSQRDGSTIAGIFGDDLPETIVLLDDDTLIDQVWKDPAAIAIVPFEELEPRWKVLELDGLSPVRNDFDLDQYPLKVEFGLSGDPDSVSFMIESILWPASNRDPERLSVLLMTGVTALTRATAWTMEIKGLEYPAEKIGQWFLDADITHISNEVSFLDTCPAPTPIREGLIFCSDPEYVKLFETIDVDVIELTGNHLKDYGEEGLSLTLEMYEERDWGIFGGGANLEESFQPLLIEHNGNKLAFLGCNSAGPGSVWAKENSPGATPCDYQQLYPELERLKSEGYITIFTFQWNEYYQVKPSSEQVEDFRAAIDAGALIVNGSQAHQPQAMEFYGDGLIHYGLGNLFFDQMWAIAVRQEFLDRHVFYDGKHISTELLTAFLEDFAQPRPMTVEERAFFLQEIFKASGW